MRTVILIPEMHAGSELALNKLCKSKDLQIVGLISANQGKRHWIRYGIRRSGLLYATMIGIMAYLHIVGVLIASLLLWHRKRKWLTVKEIIKKYNIPLHATKDINGEETIKIIRKWKPDLVISLYFNQLLLGQKRILLDLAKFSRFSIRYLHIFYPPSFLKFRRV